jgi:hypothetical protein
MSPAGQRDELRALIISLVISFPSSPVGSQCGFLFTVVHCVMSL